jgi:hypothetical protein
MSKLNSRIRSLILIVWIGYSFHLEGNAQMSASPANSVDSDGFLRQDKFDIIDNGKVLASFDRWKSPMSPFQLLGVTANRIFLIFAAPTGIAPNKFEYILYCEVYQRVSDTLELESASPFSFGSFESDKVPYSIAITNSSLVFWVQGRNGIRFGVSMDLRFYQSGDLDNFAIQIRRMRKKFMEKDSESHRLSLDNL